jgi:hypothetical protein
VNTIVGSVISAVGTLVGVVLTNELQLRRQTRQIQQRKQEEAGHADRV